MNILPVGFNIFGINKQNKKMNNVSGNRNYSYPNLIPLSRDVVSFSSKIATKNDSTAKFKNEFKKKLATASEDELFAFIYSSLLEQAENKKINHCVSEDVVGNAIVDILENFNEFSNNNITVDELTDRNAEIYENLKPSSGDYIQDYGVESLDKKNVFDSDITLNDCITEDNLPKYLSKPDKEQIKKAQKELNGVLKDVFLTEKEKKFLQDRYDDERISYKTVGLRNGVSGETARSIINVALFKIRDTNQELSEKETQFIKDFQNVFPQLDEKDVKNIIMKYYQILSRSPRELLDKKIIPLTKKFETEGLTVDDYINCCRKQPKLFTQSSDIIENNVVSTVKKFEKAGLTVKDYIACCKKQPPLFALSPDTIENHVISLVKKFEKDGLTVKDYIECCKRQPQLFFQSSDTIENNIISAVKKFEKEGLTVKDYIKCCKKQPSLFEQSSDTIENNVISAVKKFEKEGLTVKDYIKCCKKQAPLFTLYSDTIENNVVSAVKKFEKEGLTVKDYIKCCKKQPSLFAQSSDTIENNVISAVKKFEKEGLTVKDYIKCCRKHPSLFVHSPETIYKNVVSAVKKFEKEGLTVKDYIACCKKQPSLFALSSDTIENDVLATVKKFEKEGLTLKDYIACCKKQPQLFYQSSDTIENNVFTVVKKFKKEGLTINDYLNCCKKQPSLFVHSPETIYNNAVSVVEKFEKEGLTLDNYIPVCVQQPSLFYFRPETVAEHINAYKYIAKNNHNYDEGTNISDFISKKHLTNSTSLIYLQGIIRPQIKKQDEELSDLKFSGLKPRLQEYFKEHPDKKFKINIVKDELSNDFVKSMEEFSLKEYGKKDVFIFNFID